MIIFDNYYPYKIKIAGMLIVNRTLMGFDGTYNSKITKFFLESHEQKYEFLNEKILLKNECINESQLIKVDNFKNISYDNAKYYVCSEKDEWKDITFKSLKDVKRTYINTLMKMII